MTLSIVKLMIMKLGIITFSIMTLSIMKLMTTKVSVTTYSIKDAPYLVQFCSASFALMMSNISFVLAQNLKVLLENFNFLLFEYKIKYKITNT
jgi:hypothetical protein